MFGTKHSEKTVWDKFPELKSIPEEKFPKHLLLIPDGNGRWAKLYHKNITEGHKKGAEVIKNIYNDLWQLPIKFITIWGFSADNWSRTREEADGIMHVIDETLKVLLPQALERNERIMHIGRKDRIPAFLRDAFENAEKLTEKNTGTVLSLAVDYA
jgi:undecaprenyl diphosphate synthase